MRVLAVMALVGAVMSPGWAVASEDCGFAPKPVFSLGYGSRYVESDTPGTVIDAKARSAAEKELKPVDDFLKSLAKVVLSKKAGLGPDCALAQMAVWARANALEDLKTQTTQLTVGSRIASFGMIAMQAGDQVGHSQDLAIVGKWLGRLMARQMVFWEEGASSGAKRGNLRAWAALAGAAVAAVKDDPTIRGWAAWSVQYVLCTAAPDGSLPQEMRRGKYALHYQLHAISALVVASAVLERQGVSARAACDGALGRVVNFAMDDLGTGQATARITGKTQSYFDGSEAMKPFNFAWIEAYLTLRRMPGRDRLDQFAEQYRPLSYSKLGGNQTRLWSSKH